MTMDEEVMEHEARQLVETIRARLAWLLDGDRSTPCP